MQLMKESATAMRPPIPMLMVVLTQRKRAKFNEIWAAITSLGEVAGVLGQQTTEVPFAAALRLSHPPDCRTMLRHYVFAVVPKVFVGGMLIECHSAA